MRGAAGAALLLGGLALSGPAACSREPVEDVASRVALRIVRFEARPPKVQAGGAVTLEWETAGALNVEILPAVGFEGPSGRAEVRPLATTEYTLTARGEGQALAARVTVEVTGVVEEPRPGAPSVPSFTATPAQVAPGQPSTPTGSLSAAGNDCKPA